MNLACLISISVIYKGTTKADASCLPEYVWFEDPQKDALSLRGVTSCGVSSLCV